MGASCQNPPFPHLFPGYIYVWTTKKEHVKIPSKTGEFLPVFKARVPLLLLSTLVALSASCARVLPCGSSVWGVSRDSSMRELVVSPVCSPTHGSALGRIIPVDFPPGGAGIRCSPPWQRVMLCISPAQLRLQSSQVQPLPGSGCAGLKGSSVFLGRWEGEEPLPIWNRVGILAFERFNLTLI